MSAIVSRGAGRHAHLARNACDNIVVRGDLVYKRKDVEALG